MAQELKDGSFTNDSRLDRIVQFDERSREYPVRGAGVTARPRSYTWRVPSLYVIDQGYEGACVGFSVTNEAIARPAEVMFAGKLAAEDFALDVYHQAQHDDPWSGCSLGLTCPIEPTRDKYDGTSVLAGLRVMKSFGYFEEYRWAFSLEDVVYGIGHNGPAVLGIDWFDSMYVPSDGWVRVDGTVVGGHAILAVAVKVHWKDPLKFWRYRTFADVDLDKSYVVLYNSWGAVWGEDGYAKLSLRDLGKLLDRRGEAAFAIKRTANVA